MPRPFYSLAILLEIIAVSLVLVGSAHSQTGVPTIDVASAAAHGGGWLWQGTSARSVRRNLVEITQAIQSVPLARPSNPATDALPWTLADDQIIPPAIISTGYDAAYDFAMLEGQYYDLAPSQIDIEGSMANMSSDEETLPAESIDCPGPAPFDDDLNCCLEPRVHGWCENYSFEPSDVVESNVSPEEAQHTWLHIRAALERTAEFGGTLLDSYRAPFVQPQADELTVAEAQLALQELERAMTHTGEVIQIAIESSWKPFSYHRLVIEARNFSFDSIDWRQPAFPVASTVHLSEGQQIVLLTQAAATLDEVGLYLQDTAQHLRYLAADRIVKKNANRRIARENSR